ncbi:MAG: ATPase, T2SS/T4P/T4SS family [Bacillota bacterium]
MRTETSRKLLGEILLEKGVITAEALQEALDLQKQTGERLGRVLVDLGYVSEHVLVEALAGQLGIRYVHLDGLALDPELVRSVPEKLIRRHKAVPLRRDGSRLRVAMSDPLNVTAVDDLRLVSGCEIDPVLALESELDLVIRKHLGFPDLEETAGAFDDVEVVRSEVVSLNPGEPMDDEAPVVRVVNSMIMQAIRDGASDVHVEHLEEQVRIRCRVDGLLRDLTVLPPKFRYPLVSRLKIMARLDIAEKRVPQDGRFQVRYRGREIDFRVSTMPTVFGEKVVIRILDKTRMINQVDKLGFSAANRQRLTGILRHPYGMVLITGPTGSGKTTTLYAILSELNSPALNVITIEDPVEYILPGVNQIPINPRAGLTFSRGLRSILRQDPDIIMVGEIRDAETAEIAVRAATTGHLVFSTLHTNTAVGALSRLVDIGIEPFLVASSVLGVVAQRLVRVICPRCRESYHPAPGGLEWYFAGQGPDETVTLHRGMGCTHCGRTGYRGRTTIGEVLPLSAVLRQMVCARAGEGELESQAVQEGFILMKDDGLEKVRRGITTVSEIMRVAYVD